MADTRRELSALQAIINDNTSGDISPQDARDVLVSDHPSKQHQTTASASLPSDPVTGDIHFPTDGLSVNRYSGSAFVPWGPCFPLVDPNLQTWAWINQGGAVITTVGKGLCINDTAGGGSWKWALRKKAAPSAPYKVDVLLSGLHGGTANGDFVFGVGFRASASGKLHTALFYCNSGIGIGYCIFGGYKFDDATTYNSVYDRGDIYNGTTPIFVRLEDDNTNRKIHLSTNGQVWTQFSTVGRTDFITADEVFFGVSAMSAPGQMTVNSWYEH